VIIEYSEMLAIMGIAFDKGSRHCPAMSMRGIAVAASAPLMA